MDIFGCEAQSIDAADCFISSICFCVKLYEQTDVGIGARRDVSFWHKALFLKLCYTYVQDNREKTVAMYNAHRMIRSQLFD